MVSLTSCADPLLVDGPNLDRLRDALQVDGIVAREVAAVVLLGKGAAAKSPEINNFPNKKIFFPLNLNIDSHLASEQNLWQSDGDLENSTSSMATTVTSCFAVVKEQSGRAGGKKTNSTMV